MERKSRRCNQVKNFIKKTFTLSMTVFGLLITSVYAGEAILPLVFLGYIGGLPPGDLFPGAVSYDVSGYRCSGVKVSDRKILTAAHCIGIRTKHFISVGDQITVHSSLQGIQGHSYEDTTYESKVKNIAVHPSWQKLDETMEYADLAVIEVEESIPFLKTAQISTVPLKLKQKVVVGGFGCKGRAFSGHGHYSIGIKEVQSFKHLYFEIGLLDFDKRTQSMLCLGDSGGPAYLYNSSAKEYEVVGINSMGPSDEGVLVDADNGSIKDVSENIQIAGIITRIALPEELDTSPPVGEWLKATLNLSAHP
jgi:V8-like Glu-specific endopeptidase